MLARLTKRLGVAAHHQGAQDCGGRQKDPSAKAGIGAAPHYSTATKGRNGGQAGHSAGAQDHHSVTRCTRGSDDSRPACGGNSACRGVRAPASHAWPLRAVIPCTGRVPVRILRRLFSPWRAADVSAGSIHGSGADGAAGYARYAWYSGVRNKETLIRCPVATSYLVIPSCIVSDEMNICLFLNTPRPSSLLRRLLLSSGTRARGEEEEREEVRDFIG